MTIELYFAVSRSGQGRVFTTKPVRMEELGVWDGKAVGYLSMFMIMAEYNGFKLPDISWDDEPRKIIITVENE